MPSCTKQLAVLAVILSCVCSIYIPLTGRVPRCMIVYSVGESETVKLEITFPPMNNQQSNQHYSISWKNTQNNQVTSQTIESGKFKRQLVLTQNVIYDLCIQAQSYRDFGIVHVEYHANNLFAVNQAEVKVPENILKNQDITSAFINANDIEKNLDAFIKIQNQKNNGHAEIFRKTNLISQKLLQISIVELLVIVLAGCYQFWTLWKYLKNKNYI